MALGITMLMVLMLMNVAGAAPFADIQNSGSNHVSNFNKFNEAINAYDKAIEINPLYSLTRYGRASADSPINKKGTIEVKILAINDFHGQLESSSRQIVDCNRTTGACNSIDAGGAEYLATHIKKLKSENPNTFVVSAGDSIGASPLISAHYHDEPTIKALNVMGLDFSAVGNHELDKGLGELIRIQNGSRHPKDGCLVDSSFEGAHFQFLAANIVNESTNATVFPAYAVTYVQGVPIGFIGVAMEDTPNVVLPSAVKGLKFLNESETINKYVRELQEKGVKTIVVLIHNGGYQKGLYNEIQNKSGPIFDVVNNIDHAVDVFITGHTHQAYNALINGSIVTQADAQGSILTDIDLVINNETHAVIEKRARNIVASRDVPKDSKVVELVMEYQRRIAPIANTVIGNITSNITQEPNGRGESALGDLIADVQLYNTANLSYGGAVVAFANPEGIRSKLICLNGSKLPCNVTYGEAFSVQPFGNKLVTMTLNGTQIDDLLEQQFNTSFGNKGVLLQVSKGFGYTWNKNAPVGKKVNISSIKINGTPIDPNSFYNVTVDEFMAEGGNNFSVLEAEVNRTNLSRLDIDATVNYFNHFSPVSPGPENRIAVVE